MGVVLPVVLENDSFSWSGRGPYQTLFLVGSRSHLLISQAAPGRIGGVWGVGGVGGFTSSRPASSALSESPDSPQDQALHSDVVLRFEPDRAPPWCPAFVGSPAVASASPVGSRGLRPPDT